MAEGSVFIFALKGLVLWMHCSKRLLQYSTVSWCAAYFGSARAFVCGLCRPVLLAELCAGGHSGSWLWSSWWSAVVGTVQISVIRAILVDMAAETFFQPIMVTQTVMIEGGLLRRPVPLPVLRLQDECYVCVDVSDWMCKAL